ncbi:MAG: hypothetical protein AAFO69_19635 [Bacteroidota bacterium]
MKKINPYKSYRYALASLDNGGRFYNLRSKANDGDITSAELRKAAGVFSGRQNLMVYLEMSLMDLTEKDHEQVISHLSDQLKSDYREYKPERFTPSEAKQHTVVSQSAIITGIPKLIDSKMEFSGFVMIPIMVGKTTTFSIIPIIDQYDVYELRDEHTAEEFFIAHNRSSRKLPEQSIRCGGVIKELKDQKGHSEKSFLEILFYSI